MNVDQKNNSDIDSKFTVYTENSDGRKIKKHFYYFTPDSIRYVGRHNFLVNLGYYEKGTQKITITFPMAGHYTMDDFKIYCQPMDQYPQQIAKLKENVLENVNMGTNEITGTIHLDKKKIVCLSLPYSKGWKAYVDGKEQEILQANTMYMALDLDEGDHKIELRYFTPGLKAGILLSVFGFACLIGIWFWYRKKDNCSRTAKS